jgi:Domain of unknown function (DUF4384)
MRFLKPLCGMALLAGLALTAVAADPKDDPKKPPTDPKPRQLFVQAVNDTMPWKVTVKVDRDDKTYKVGDEVVITVNSEREGYLYVFNLDPSEQITLLYPNNLVKDNFIKAKEDVVIPDEKAAKAGGRITVGEPSGKDIVKVVVTSKPLETMKLDELNKGLKNKVAYPPVPPKQAKALFFEVMTGNTQGGTPTGTLQEDKAQFQQQNPEQVKQKAREWAGADLELTTSGKGKPPLDKPKPDQDKPPVDKPKPTQDKPTQDKPTQDKPSQDKPTQDKPKDKPTQDKPTQDKPTQDKPTQDKPKDKPTQDKPSQDKPKQDDKKPDEKKP